jgi:nicotinamidase-related amidase
MNVCRPMLIAAVAAALMAGSAARAQTVLEEWSSAKTPPAPEAKPVTVEAAKTALFVMDFNKNGCTPERRARCVAVLPKVQKILNEARAKGVVVIHTLAGTTTAADIVSELAPKQGERVVSAPIDKFYGNDLEKALKDRGIDTVILTGTSSNGAVLFTAGGSAMRGFKVVVPVDGMPGDGVYQEQFAAWNIVNGPTVREKATLTKIDMISFK